MTRTEKYRNLREQLKQESEEIRRKLEKEEVTTTMSVDDFEEWMKDVNTHFLEGVNYENL